MRMPTQQELDRLFTIANYIHLALAGLSFLLFMWGVANHEAGSTGLAGFVAAAVFMGLYFSTRSLQRALCPRPAPVPEVQTPEAKAPGK